MEGMDGAIVERRGGKNSVKADIKDAPFFLIAMFLQAGAVHSITRHAEAGASSSLKSLLEEFLMQHCNRQQAQTPQPSGNGPVASRLRFQPALLCLAIGEAVMLAEIDLANRNGGSDQNR